METKLWEFTFSKEDVETLFGKPISDGEWNIIVDELYNNDELYKNTTDFIIEIVKDAITIE
jgi:hypothetical protein